MILLCIDDDQEDMELFQEAVSIIDKSSVCVFASNGREGLDILRNTIPDCIFLDINMPIMDGKETLMKIRRDRRFKSIPVFILSTTRDNYEVELCRALGANRFLVKPGSFSELVDCIRSVIEEPRYFKIL